MTASLLRLALVVRYVPSDFRNRLFSCNLPDAGSHLQRALHVFREAIRKSNATAQRQMLITEMLPKRT